jgi:hypothetical protein
VGESTPPLGIEEQVRRLLRQRGGLPSSADLDGEPLGAGGLGLDSVALLETVLACEALVGRPLPELLLAAGPLTAGDLARRAAAAAEG